MRHVIIGSGVAGMTAALDLSRQPEAEVEIYTAEPYAYYYRPQLTNFLAGSVALEQVVRRTVEWYTERGIYLHLDSPVATIRPAEKRILLADGRPVTYDRLLLATGSQPFVPPIENVTQAGVFTLRTLADALQIRAYARDCRQAVVVGGGLLGLEAARGLQGMGLEVSIVELFPWLMPVQLDEAGGEILRRFVLAQGYAVHTGSAVSRVEGEGEVTGVGLAEGQHLPAQLLLIAAGVRPNTALATEAGLEVDRGVVVDERMATSVPDVYAAGDAASFRGVCWAIVTIAQAQARVAAASMAGDGARYEPIVPVTSLKVLGVEVSSAGKTRISEAERGAGYEEFSAGDPEAFTYRKLVLHEGQPVGAMVIGDKALAKALIARVEEGKPLSPTEARTLLAG